MTKAKEILELYMPDADDFDIQNKTSFVQAKRAVDRDPSHNKDLTRVSTSKLLDKRYYQPPEEVKATVDNMPQQQQMQAVGQLAQAMEQNDPQVMKQVNRLPSSTKKRVLKAMGAGAFWTAAIYSMPWLGIPLLGIRLFQRYKAKEGPTWRERMAKTPPKWV